jgi:hypothetical protein
VDAARERERISKISSFLYLEIDWFLHKSHGKSWQI